MKYIIAVLLICSVFLFQFSELLVLLSFKINQDYISKNLCIEKDVEDSTCKGCCQLKLRLNEQEKQKKELPPQSREKQNIDFCEPKSEDVFVLYPNTKNRVFKMLEIYCFLPISEAFHPPAA